MIIDTLCYERCINTLEKANGLLAEANPENIDYELYLSASIKEFETILEQSAKLLRKVLNPYFHSSKEADKLSFKDVFRQALLRSIINIEMCERWMTYRDNRNNTAHDYGVNFAEETLTLIPQFIADSKTLAEIIKQHTNVAEG